MSQTMSAPVPVNASARPARRRAGGPAGSTSADQTRQKKVRRNGMVASTILLTPEVDEMLSWMARAKKEERSVLASRFIMQGLARNTSIVDDLLKAAERFKKLASAKSDEGTDRPGDGADVSQESSAA
jgi:predicted transcriptional regulator